LIPDGKFALMAQAQDCSGSTRGDVMNLHRLLFLALVGASLSGNANASRGVPVDTWEGASPGEPGYNTNAPPLPMGSSLVFTSSTQLVSGSLPSWLDTLTISPGQLSGTLIGGVPQVNQHGTSEPQADMWGFSTTEDNPLQNQSTGGQVALFPTSNILTVDLNYAATSCAGQTASISINGLTFSSSNPCKAGKDTNDPFPPYYDYNQSAFEFGLNSAGKVVLEDSLPAGWSAVTNPVSAPEIDPHGILTELVLLIGCFAVARSSMRRRGELA
jgi:hypothetical protein